MIKDFSFFPIYCKYNKYRVMQKILATVLMLIQMTLNKQFCICILYLI